MFPEQLKYTAEHEWIDAGAGEQDSARIGITDYAQEQLGDIVYAQLPDVGSAVTAGEVCGELESTKSVSDIYAPITGTVVAHNDAVISQPELVNTDPYKAGWMFDVAPADPAAVDGLMSAADYQASVEG